MKKLIFLLGFAAVMFVSCDSKPSLQKYFVEKAGTKNFTSVDIAPTFIKTDSLQLSADEKTALESLHKLNVLVFKADSVNKDSYNRERENVKNLLKSEEYGQLMKYGSGSEGAAIYTTGTDEHIDEFVVFVHQEDNGFGVIRVLGDDMNPNNILSLVSLMRKADLNLEQLKPLQDLMKK